MDRTASLVGLQRPDESPSAPRQEWRLGFALPTPVLAEQGQPGRDRRLKPLSRHCFADGNERDLGRITTGTPAGVRYGLKNSRSNCPEFGNCVSVWRSTQSSGLALVLLRRPPEEARDLQVCIVIRRPRIQAVRAGTVEGRGLNRYRHGLSFWGACGAVHAGKAGWRASRHFLQ